MARRFSLRFMLMLFSAIAIIATTIPARAQNTAALDADARQALDRLTATVPVANALAKNAAAILVFPKIVKAGFVFAAQYGEGVLLRGGKPAGYYSTAGGSYGMQAGAEQYGYALFVMNERSLRALTDNAGFNVGVGPSVVVVDEGMGRTLTTVTAKDDVYAFVFGQQGLMGGVGVQGNKITKVSN
ncbi:MAG TPA: YSC84-related protein [Casimicrobiaceae bacterium]|nr:YSC84-related protein [Casimicrobiaceae bacterium]